MAPHLIKSRLLAPLAAIGLLAALLLPAVAPASVAGRHTTTSRHSCSRKSRRSRHGASHGCAKRSHKHASHKPKKTVKSKPTAVTGLELVPAACEDGDLPVGSGSAWSCEDGSTPACEEGTLVAASATSAPMCAVKPSNESHCSPEASECAGAELACEDASEAGGAESCEHASEQEALEEQEE